MRYKTLKASLKRKGEELLSEKRKRIRRDTKIETMKMKLKEMAKYMDSEKVDHLLTMANNIAEDEMKKKKRSKIYSGTFNK